MYYLYAILVVFQKTMNFDIEGTKSVLIRRDIVRSSDTTTIASMAPK